MHKNRLGLLCIFGLLLSACGPEIIFEEKQEISPAGWTYADTLDYQFEISDTQQLYNIFLQLEHTTAFATQNLYVKIYTGFPDGKRLSQELSVELADKIGRWLGDCRGEHCTLDIPLQTKAYFNQPGQHSFTLEQYMRTSPLPGISAATLRLEVSETKRD